MKQSAYTLIEILIALLVFAILSVISATAMFHAFNTRSIVNRQADRLNRIQMAVVRFEHDTAEATARSVRGKDMLLISAFIGEHEYLEFSRTGLVNPNAYEKRSTLKRLAYLCKNHQLIRRSWEVLDSPGRRDYEDTILLDSLQHCSFSYLAANRQLLPIWRANAQVENQKGSLLPIAIQLNLKFSANSDMSMLFIIPEALYA